MKSLNRTLSLVLVLVMVFGLMGVASASSSSYTDSTTVGAAYAEAVDVLTGIGVVNGTTSTTLEPTGNYTREQAAKVICYLTLGKTTSDALACSTAPFTDVAAARWSAGFIQYCVSQGIINGMGDGTFAPEANLTGYQFAKMLLSALGYGKSGEFTGNGWEIAVAKEALGLKLFKGDTAAATNNFITRQQAMLMAFNAMFKGTVKATYAYDNGVKYVASYSDPDLAKSFAATIYGYDADVDVANTSDLVLVPSTVNGVDGHYWFYKGTAKPVTAFFSDETVIGTSTNGKSIATLSLDSNANAYFIATVSGGTDYFVNGDSGYDLADAEDYIGLGVKVVFVDTDDNTDTAEKVYITTYEVAVLAAAPSVKTNTVDGKSYVYVNFVANTDIGVSAVTTGVGAVLASDVTGYAGLVKGDVVLVNYYDNGTFNIVKATSFTGKATASSTSALTIDGTVYKVAENAAFIGGGSYAEGFLNTVTFYTDTTGYLVYAKAVTATSTDYLYVIASDDYDAATTFASASNQSYVAFATGATATITVSTVDSTAFTDGGMTVPAAGEIYSYVKNSDGTYTLISETETMSTLCDAAASADADGAFTKGASAVTSAGGDALKTNAATVYVLRDIKTAGTHSIDHAATNVWTDAGTIYKTTWTVYTGYTNMITASSAQYAAVVGTDGYADVVFVSNYNTTAATDKSVIYLLDTTATAVYKTATTVDYYTFPAIVDGVKTTVKAPAAIAGNIEALNGAHALGADYYVADGTLLAVSYSDGKLSGLLPVSDHSLGNALCNASLLGNFKFGTEIVAPANGVIEIDGVGYNYSATTVVFYISADMSTVTMDVASNLSDDDTSIISAVTEAAGVTSPTAIQQNTLKAIFVQAK